MHKRYAFENLDTLVLEKRMDFLLCITLPQIHIETLVIFTIQREQIGKITLILLLPSLQNVECILPTEANPKQQSALLLPAIPFWLCLSQH